MRISRRIAPGLAALGVAALSGTVLVGHALVDRQPYAAAPVATSAAVQAHANAVFESFSGTQVQRDAGGVLQAYALNGAMDQCMATNGYPQWDWSKRRNVAPRTDAMGTSVFFAAPMPRAYSQSLMDRAAELNASREDTNQTVTEAEDRAITACIQSTPPTSDDAADAQGTPGTASTLRSQWWRMLETLDGTYGDREAFERCFIAADVHVGESRGLGWDATVIGLGKLVPAAMPSSAADPVAQSRQWQDLVDAETAMEKASWDCREATYNAHLEDVDAAITKFAAAHEVDIAAAQIAWQGIDRDAHKLGVEFRPAPAVQVGPR